MSVTPCLQQLGRQRDVGHLGHARVAAWAGSAYDDHVAGFDVEVGVVGNRVVVLGRVEDDGAALVLEQFGRGGGLLEHGSVGAEVAAEHGRTRPRGQQRLVERPDDLGVPALGVGIVLADAATGDRDLLGVQQTVVRQAAFSTTGRPPA